jgi:PDZ domain-containing protein
MHFPLRLRCSLIIFALAAGLALAVGDGATTAGKGLLGVAVADSSPQWPGALIGRVAPETAAARAGLQPQDLIVQADSQPIRSAADLTAYLGTHRAGDRIELTVMRRDGSSLARIQVGATLGAAPDQGYPAPASARQTSPTPPLASSATEVTPAQGLSEVSWTTFTDPYENAFTIEVPRGWKVAGGVYRKVPLWGNLVLRVLSPDRRTLIAVGDPDSVPYTAPIAGQDYVRRFTQNAIDRACTGLKIIEVHELHDVEQYAMSHSLGTYNQWSAAQASFTCNGERQAGMSGKAIAVMQYMTRLQTGHVQVLAAFVTTSGQEGAADQLLNHMIQSSRQNPAWSAEQQHTAEGLRQGAMARWRGEQRQFAQMEDAITNTAHFTAPDGRRYDLDARPRYQWLAREGRTVGTDTPTAPSPDAQLLQRLPE